MDRINELNKEINNISSRLHQERNEAYKRIHSEVCAEFADRVKEKKDAVNVAFGAYLRAHNAAIEMERERDQESSRRSKEEEARILAPMNALKDEIQLLQNKRKK